MGIEECPIKLTKEEKTELDYIRRITGKGYIRGYCVKMVHVCPKCGNACGWRQFTECLGCGFKLNNSEEYFKLKTVPRWDKI